MGVLEMCCEVSRVLDSRYRGKYMSSDLNHMDVISYEELPVECKDIVQRHCGMLNDPVRSLSVSRLLGLAPVEFLEGYVDAYDVFEEDDGSDARVFLVDYYSYPRARTFLSLMKNESAEVDAPDFDSRNFGDVYIVHLHMVGDTFHETSYTEDGVVDITENDHRGISDLAVSVMEWVDTRIEEISEIYIFLRSPMSGMHLCRKDNGEYAVLVY